MEVIDETIVMVKPIIMNRSLWIPKIVNPSSVPRPDKKPNINITMPISWADSRTITIKLVFLFI